MGAFFMPKNEGDTLAFEQFDDLQLADHLNAVIAEQERRARLAAVPAQIRDLATRYLEDGSDPSELTLPGGADA